MKKILKYVLLIIIVIILIDFGLKIINKNLRDQILNKVNKESVLKNLNDFDYAIKDLEESANELKAISNFPLKTGDSLIIYDVNFDKKNRLLIYDYYLDKDKISEKDTATYIKLLKENWKTFNIDKIKNSNWYMESMKIADATFVYNLYDADNNKLLHTHKIYSYEY